MARRPPLPEHRPARAFTAAARRIEPDDTAAAAALRARRRSWHDEAWTYYDDVGEAKHAARYIARSLSRLRFVPGWYDDDRANVRVTDEVALDAGLPDVYLAAARDALDRVGFGARGGWPALLNRYGVNAFVAGESWLIGGTVDRGDGPVEQWGVYSTSEVTAVEEGGTVRWSIRQDDNDPNGLTVDDPVILRVWSPHGRWYERPDSPMRGVLDVCEELLILTRAVRANGLSRLASKVLFLPTTMTGGDGAPITYDEHGDPVDNDEAGSPFVADLHQHFIQPIGDPGSQDSVAPFVIEADPDDIAAVRVEDLSRPIEGLIAEREQLIERFAQGVDLPVEVVIGKAAANHWSAWQITEDEYRAYVEPIASEFAEAIVSGYYRQALGEYGIDAGLVERSTIYVDPTDLVQRPDRSTVTFAAWDRHLTSDAYTRDELGIPQEAAPDDDELARRTAAAAAAATPAPASTEQNGPPPPPGTATVTLPAVTVPIVAAANRRRPRPLGERLAALDAALLARLTVAADAALARAIERAGARIRSKAGKTPAAEAVRSVDNALVAATLGPAVVAALDVSTESLIDGAFDGFAADAAEAIARTQAATRSALAASIDEFDEDDEELVARQDDDRRAAVAALGASLAAVATSRLFDPSPKVQPGEAPLSTGGVPPGVIRESLSRAGGAGQVGPGGAGVAADGLPTGGVATGVSTTETLVRFGIKRTGFVWQYGDPAARMTPFDPHLDLDGVEFSSWGDDALVNDGDWPPEPFFYPGDHLWCQCSFAPVLDAGGDAEGDDGP